MSAAANRIRTWVTGDMEYTETRVFHVERGGQNPYGQQNPYQQPGQYAQNTQGGQQASGARAKQPGEWFCPNCGHLNAGKFCTECGTKKPE